MALVEDTLFGHEDKVQKAIDRLKAFCPPEGYYVAFSGGKDSQCVYHLCQMAGVKFDAHYSVTSVDPPELIYFIKKHYPDVIWDHHYWNDGKPHHYNPDGSPKPITMWGLIEDHTIPPTRTARYCCANLKEPGGSGRVVVTGVRWAESNNRKMLHGVADIQTESKKLHEQAAQSPSYRMDKNGGINFMDDNAVGRKMVEQCYAKRKTTINPIVDWLDEDVWEYLNCVAKVPHCCLYDEGFTRLGCIGCPLAGKENMLRAFARWPKYKELYIRAFDRMIKNHPGEIKVATGELVENVSGGGASNLHIMARVDGISTTGDEEDMKSLPTGSNRAAENSGGGEYFPIIQTDQSFTTIGSSTAPRGMWSSGSRTANDGETISGLLAMAVQAESNRQRAKADYNHDPSVADFDSGAACLEWWVDK